MIPNLDLRTCFERNNTTNNYELQIELIIFVLIAMFVAVSLGRRVIIILWDAPPLLATEKPPEPAFIVGSGEHNEKTKPFLSPSQSSNGEGKRLLGQKHPETIDVSGSTKIAGWKMEHVKMSFLLKMGIFHRMILGNQNSTTNLEYKQRNSTISKTERIYRFRGESMCRRACKELV